MKPEDRIRNLQSLLGDGGSKLLDLAPKYLTSLIKHRDWETATGPGFRQFDTFEAFVTCPGYQGLNTTLDHLMRICYDNTDAVKAIRGEVPELGDVGNGNKWVKADNVRLDKHGNNQTYTLKRLKRDNPDLAQQVIDGELSANAAAIKAGFRRKMVSVPADLDGFVVAALKRFTIDELAAAFDRAVTK